MKNYNIIIPEKKNFCVCSCLQAILNFEGKNISQKNISEKLTPSNNGCGFKVNDNKIKRFLFERGFNYEFYWRNETPFNEPELILEDIEREKNHGLVGIKDHVFLFYNFKYPELKLIDPNDKKIKTKDYSKLIKEMYNTEGFFALIKKNKSKHILNYKRLYKIK